MLRIFLFGSAVVGLLVVTLIYAVVDGHYAAGQPVASPTPGGAGTSAPAIASTSAGPSTPAGASASAAASAGPSAQASPSASAVPASVTPSGSGSATAVRVVITKFSFGPNLTIAAGTTVTFMNADPVKHTASNGKNGALASAPLFDLQLEAGASQSYTFTNPGTYQVTCTLHSTMNMTITVQ